MQGIKKEVYLKKKKNKKREYGRNRYHNMSEEKNKNLKNIKKNIVKLTKTESVTLIKNAFIRNKLLILMIFFLISLCSVLAQ